MSDNDSLRIAVIGAGALGTLIGAHLARSGADIELFHHDPAYAAELDGAVTVRRGDGDDWSTEVAASTDPTSIGVVDMAIVTVRSYQTRQAVTDHQACFDSTTRALTLQNGLAPYEALREMIGAERLLAGVTYQGVILEKPGVVKHTAAGPTTFGGPDRAFAERTACCFRDGGFEPISVVDDPEPILWEKQLVSGAIKPLAAITRRTNAELLNDPKMQDVMRQVIDEIKDVAEAADIEVTQEDIVAQLYRSLSDSNHRSSMLQDIEAKRRTEIEAINGAIVNRAEAVDVDVPYNRLLTALVHGLERSYLSDE